MGEFSSVLSTCAYKYPELEWEIVRDRLVGRLCSYVFEIRYCMPQLYSCALRKDAVGYQGVIMDAKGSTEEEAFNSVLVIVRSLAPLSSEIFYQALDTRFSKQES